MATLKGTLTATFRKLPIAWKFTLAAVCLIMLIMITVNALIVTHQKGTLREELEGNHLTLARGLAKDVVEPLMFLDPLRLDEHLQVTGQAPGCAFAMLLDRAGRVVGHTDRRSLGSYYPDAATSSATFQVERIFERSDPPVREVWVPVTIGRERIGTAVVGFSNERVEGIIEGSLVKLKQYLFGISVGVLLIGIWGAFLLAKALTTPMKRLREGMERVESGGLASAAVENEGAKCWEMMLCERRECPAHGSERRCWTVYKDSCLCGEPARQSGTASYCRSCIVYRETCGDEVGELVESFNEMVRRLRESLNELERTTQEKARLEKFSALGEMSMTVAHEIKNPLNAIRGAVSYLRDNFEGDVLREFLGIIEAETKRLNEIVTQYLVFARPSPLRRQMGDFNKAVSDVANLIRQEALEGNKEVVVHLDAGMEPFLFDVHQMKQAILNILVNAVDATEPADTITVSTVRHDGTASVIISDTGAGIASEVLPEIFKPFYTTKTRGSGLGLACVERIIRDHHGNVYVSSAPGGGTEFVLSIPIVQEP